MSGERAAENEERTSIPAGWPDAVVDALRAFEGEPRSVERLGGMSVARVYRVDFASGSVIVKASPRPAETRFYEETASRLRAAGIPIPLLKGSAHEDGEHWLVLEYLPGPAPSPPLPWQPDPRIAGVLAVLHRETHLAPPGLPGAKPLAWTSEATDAALSCFMPGAAARLRPALERFQEAYERLNTSWCWVSGDPSPPNWGTRADGSLVLFDWELFRPGVPAHDLAPAVPGRPDMAAFLAMAECYLEQWDRWPGELPWTATELARDTAVAKVATVVMLLRATATGAARVPDAYLADLVSAAPAWLEGLAADLFDG